MVEFHSTPLSRRIRPNRNIP